MYYTYLCFIHDKNNTFLPSRINFCPLGDNIGLIESAYPNPTHIFCKECL